MKLAITDSRIIMNHQLMISRDVANYGTAPNANSNSLPLTNCYTLITTEGSL